MFGRPARDASVVTSLSLLVTDPDRIDKVMIAYGNG